MVDRGFDPPPRSNVWLSWSEGTTSPFEKLLHGRGPRLHFLIYQGGNTIATEFQPLPRCTLVLQDHTPVPRVNTNAMDGQGER